MARGYVIKTTATATESNENFKGTSHSLYIVKGGKVREMDSYIWDDEIYKTKSNAQRMLKSVREMHREESEKWGFWTFTEEIVAVD